MSSGVKPEQIDYIKAQIKKLKAEITDLNLKIRNQTITSPLNGIFRNSYSPDTLLVIEDADDLIMKIPVQVSEKDNVFLGQRIVCKVDGRKEIIEAEVIHISKNVSVLNARQIVLVTARFMDEDPEISPGIVVRGRFERDPILLRVFLMNKFEIFFKR
jgi:hypothetical protein